MNSQKVTTNFGKYKDTDLNQKAQHIVDSLTGNAHFPTPAPALTVLQTAITDYANALAKAVDGSKEDTVLKNQARDGLEKLLVKLALYVQLNSNDDPAIILRSGFDISKPHAPIGVVPKPDGFTVIAGQEKGSIDLGLNTVTGAVGYQYEYTDAPLTATSVWAVIVDTSGGITIHHLQSGKEYAFRVAAVGSDPSRVYSDVIASFVL